MPKAARHQGHLAYVRAYLSFSIECNIFSVQESGSRASRITDDASSHFGRMLSSALLSALWDTRGRLGSYEGRLYRVPRAEKCCL